MVHKSAMVVAIAVALLTIGAIAVLKKRFNSQTANDRRK